jgi:hypothetical protein
LGSFLAAVRGRVARGRTGPPVDIACPARSVARPGIPVNRIAAAGRDRAAHTEIPSDSSGIRRRRSPHSPNFQKQAKIKFFKQSKFELCPRLLVFSQLSRFSVVF